MTIGREVDALETEVAALRRLGFQELEVRYERLTGEPAPLISRELLALAVSYEIQRRAHRRRHESAAKEPFVGAGR
ncbi:MAG: hypothetical protein WD076_10220 [Parvularculaceae bacterium]